MSLPTYPIFSEDDTGTQLLFFCFGLTALEVEAYLRYGQTVYSSMAVLLRVWLIYLCISIHADSDLLPWVLGSMGILLQGYKYNLIEPKPYALISCCCD